MQQVVDDEHGQDHAAPSHGERSNSRCCRLPGFVTQQTRRPIHECQLNGGDNVQHDADQQNNAGHPQERTVRQQGLTESPEKRCVFVEDLLADENLDVAEHVAR